MPRGATTLFPGATGVPYDRPGAGAPKPRLCAETQPEIRTIRPDRMRALIYDDLPPALYLIRGGTDVNSVDRLAYSFRRAAVAAPGRTARSRSNPRAPRWTPFRRKSC